MGRKRKTEVLEVYERLYKDAERPHGRIMMGLEEDDPDEESTLLDFSLDENGAAREVNPHEIDDDEAGLDEPDPHRGDWPLTNMLHRRCRTYEGLDPADIRNDLADGLSLPRMRKLLGRRPTTRLERATRRR